MLKPPTLLYFEVTDKQMKTNKGLQKSKMERFAEERGVNPESIDFQSLINSDLTEEENWRNARQEVYKSKVEHHYSEFLDYARIIAKGIMRSMIVESPHGLGKTYQVTKLLEKEVGESGYAKVSGHASPMAFYEKLYENKDKVIFIDDTEGIVSNNSVLSVLKAATETEVDKRLVQWNSNSAQLDAPEEFEFEGRLIMCFNDLPDNDHMNAVKSRSIHYEFDLEYQQRIDLLNAVAESVTEEETGLTREERREVVEWLEEVTGEHTEKNDINLRTLFRTFNIYRSDREGLTEENWMDLASRLFNSDYRLVAVIRLEEEYSQTEAAAERYEEEGYGSVRDFYRKKEVLEDNGYSF